MNRARIVFMRDAESANVKQRIKVFGRDKKCPPFADMVRMPASVDFIAVAVPEPDKVTHFGHVAGLTPVR